MAHRIQAGLSDSGLTARADLCADLVVGVSSGPRNACACVCAPDGVLGICEQERVTRVRAAGLNPSGWPDEAINELLRFSGRTRRQIAEWVQPTADHFAHASTAYLSSPFDAAAIVVCDHDLPSTSIWEGEASHLSPVEWPWLGVGLAELYTLSAAALGFNDVSREQRFEALARFHGRNPHLSAIPSLEFCGDHLNIDEAWSRRIAAWDRGYQSEWASGAAAIQCCIGDALVELIAAVKRKLPGRTKLCLAGSLFLNSYFNSRVKQSAIFEEVFVPVNPANAGLSLGVALQANVSKRHVVGPFLGPSYGSEEVKTTLDNCKLTYQWVSEDDTIGVAVEALQRGRLVAWFDDRMEWGPRALGARSIIANPFSTYVLDNLNRFLKQREPWRGYALSVLASAAREQFEGPSESPFMECDFSPKDRPRYRHVLPSPDAGIRVQTVDGRAPNRFRALLEAFGEASGVPVLVNTSFNGFHEPIVCSPRDAIRVFFGTGLDVLILGQFVVTK